MRTIKIKVSLLSPQEREIKINEDHMAGRLNTKPSNLRITSYTGDIIYNITTSTLLTNDELVKILLEEMEEAGLRCMRVEIIKPVIKK